MPQMEKGMGNVRTAQRSQHLLKEDEARAWRADFPPRYLQPRVRKSLYVSELCTGHLKLAIAPLSHLPVLTGSAQPRSPASPNIREAVSPHTVFGFYGLSQFFLDSCRGPSMPLLTCALLSWPEFSCVLDLSLTAFFLLFVLFCFSTSLFQHAHLIFSLYSFSPVLSPRYHWETMAAAAQPELEATPTWTAVRSIHSFFPHLPKSSL